jgi:DNA transposition AAA+ family ATPase
MTTDAKHKIKDLLQAYCKGFESQTKASKSLNDVSSATISQILNNKWELVADRMWLSIGKQVGFEISLWNHVPTYNYKLIKDLLADAKIKSRVHAITGGAGWGKDTAARDFYNENPEVYLINCWDFNRRYFLAELLRKMGKNTNGSIPDLVERVVSEINRTQKPLIILNEADKLSDQVLYFFITIYNLCEDKCGIVMLATNNLDDRLTRGVERQKRGYPEIFSRLGSRFIKIRRPSKTDITAICSANGVTDALQISEIFNSCEGDLRRAKKLIQNKSATAKTTNTEHLVPELVG